VVAERDRIGAGIDELIVDDLGDAKAACRVLTVNDDEIELPIGNERGQPLGHDGPPGAADNVADKKNTHTLFGLAEIDHFTLR
jgi:hypothetical protein